MALKTAPLVDLNLDVGSGAAVKASQGDVWAGTWEARETLGYVWIQICLAPPRELWDFTGLHVRLCVEIKVIRGIEHRYLDRTKTVSA